MPCKCNAENYEVLMDEGYIHYGKLQCSKCGANNGWIKKPENENKRTDKNTKWRLMWKEKGVFCAICGVTEEDFPVSGQWQVDHIRQIIDGGEDVFENTMMLCTFCHTIKNMEQKRRAALQRLLSRAGD